MFFRTVKSKYIKEMLCFCEVLVSVTTQLESCPTAWNTQRFLVKLYYCTVLMTFPYGDIFLMGI
jgi:hypothetical protein